MKKNKFVFPLIIVLLLIFLPLSVVGIVNASKEAKKGDNPEHLPKLNGKLYFYDGNDLKGTYKCNNESCDLAKTTIDDEYIKYYEGENNDIGYIAKDYIFIQDGDVIELISIPHGKSIAKFKLLKNYGISFSEGGMIVQNEAGLYGLFNTNAVGYLIPAEYQFLGLKNDLIDGKLNSKIYIAKKSNAWNLISSTGEKISEPLFYPIFDYDSDYIYCKNIQDNSLIKIFNYKAEEILPNSEITIVESFKDNHIISLKNGGVQIFNSTYEEMIKNYLAPNVTYEIKENSVDIFRNEVLVDTYEF